MVSTVLQGMEGVIAARSAITWVDGRQGELRYRGYAAGELAQHYSYEDVVWLLWEGQLPSNVQGEELRREMRAIRVSRTDLLNVVRSAPVAAHPLDVLRYVLSWDALRDPRAWDNSAGANRQKSLEMVAWFPLVVAAYHRMRKGAEPIMPRSDLDTAANFLFMLHDGPAREVAVRTLDTSLVLHADHELNASTFAARVTIATQSNLHAAVASALGTLAGPRHGGASERIIAMLETIGSPSDAERYVHEQLSRRERIMGFGHRVYKTVDPRARVLLEMAERLLAGTAHEPWLDILSRLQMVVERELGLYPNVDLYAALVNHELGIDPSFYTSIFAVSRVAGWLAHSVEQLDGRMIRPVAEYVGEPPRTFDVVKR